MNIFKIAMAVILVILFSLTGASKADDYATDSISKPAFEADCADGFGCNQTYNPDKNQSFQPAAAGAEAHAVDDSQVACIKTFYNIDDAMLWQEKMRNSFGCK